MTESTESVLYGIPIQRTSDCFTLDIDCYLQMKYEVTINFHLQTKYEVTITKYQVSVLMLRRSNKAPGNSKMSVAEILLCEIP